MEPVIYVGNCTFRRGDQSLLADHVVGTIEKLTANKERSGEVNKNSKIKTRAFTTDEKETEIENCKFQRKTRLIRVLHRCAHPPQATKF